MFRWWSVGSAFPTMEVTIRGSVSWLSEKLATTIFLLGFPGSSAGKESTSNAGDPGLIPGSGISAGEGVGYSLQYSCASLVPQLVKNPPAMWETWV